MPAEQGVPEKERGIGSGLERTRAVGVRLISAGPLRVGRSGTECHAGLELARRLAVACCCCFGWLAAMAVEDCRGWLSVSRRRWSQCPVMGGCSARTKVAERSDITVSVSEWECRE